MVSDGLAMVNIKICLAMGMTDYDIVVPLKVHSDGMLQPDMLVAAERSGKGAAYYNLHQLFHFVRATLGLGIHIIYPEISHECSHDNMSL